MEPAAFTQGGGHRNLTVPLYAMRALADMGRDEEAKIIRTALLERDEALAEWAQYATQQVMPGTVWRGLLDLAEAVGDTELRAELAQSVLDNDNADYGARMRALLAYREIVCFPEFRPKVAAELAESPADTPSVGRTGLEWLAQRLEGPVEGHERPRTLTAGDVEVMTAREYPVRYEDLALRVEMMLRDPKRLFATGVVAALIEAVKQGYAVPQSDDGCQALCRSQTTIGKIVESDSTEILPPPSPSGT